MKTMAKRLLVVSALLILIVVAGLFLLYSPNSPLFSFYQQSFHKLVSQNLLTDSNDENSLEMIWLGTAGVYIGDGDTGILIDPFVSKYRMAHAAFNVAIESNPHAIDDLQKLLGDRPVDIILVSHSHYDHSLDAPYIAKAYSAPVLGSESTQAICHLNGYKKTVVVGDRSKTRVGRFAIEFRQGEHGEAFFGAISFKGQVTTKDKLTGVRSYKMGKVFAIHISHPVLDLVHQASVGFKDRMYEGLSADVAVLGIALRKSSTTYTKRIIDDLGVRQIIPIHFDDFFVASEFSEMPLVRLEEYMKSVSIKFPKIIFNFAPHNKIIRIGQPKAL